jgi:hypothetical protein
MAPNLNNHIVVQRLARDLGLRSSSEPVSKVIEYCRRKVKNLIEDFDGSRTPQEILPWLAGKLSTRFVEINEDADLDRVIAEYGKKRKELAFATLDQEFDGCTEGITLRLSRRQLWEPEFVSLIDCRGRRKLRRYHTKWHELVHLLVMTDQTRMEFRRTHEAGQEKSAEERLVDVVAGELSFFPEFVEPHIRGEITFTKIEQIRRLVCPDASLTSSAINISKMWNSPCIWIEARLQAKKGAQAGVPTALRAVKVAENAAAREQGLRMIANFRVPEDSIVFRSFHAQTLDSEAYENLNWWKASSGTCLEDRIVKIEVKNFGDSVQALITPATLH